MKTMKIMILVLSIIVSGTVSGQSVKVDTEKSSLKWTGKKVGGEHFGNILLKEGSIVITKDNITSGSFVIDMNTLTNTDLTDAGYNAKLVGHLKSDDFFGVKDYPTASLKIKEATAFVNNKALVKAHLTIKGKTNPVEFNVTNNKGIYSATITVDRSKYNVKYGSSSFFDNLGDNMIYDDFTLEVKVEL